MTQVVLDNVPVQQRRRLARNLKQLKKLSPAEIDRQVAELAEAIKAKEDELEAVKGSDPFWFYEPTANEISERQRTFLSEFLRPEDIPARLDSAKDVHACTANIIGVSGGNQSSKTTTCTIEDLIKATRKIPQSLAGIYPESKLPKKKFNRIRVVCEDYQNGILKHNLPNLMRWTPRSYLIDGRWEKSWSAEKMQLTLVHPEEKTICATIELMTNNAEVGTFQGPPIDRVRYDEEPREDIFDENLLRFVTSDHLDIAFGMTPTHGLSWVYDRLWNKDSIQNNSVRWFQLCSISNPKANLETLREICKNIKRYDELKMRLLGEWISLSGLVYGSYFKRRVHVIAPEKLGLHQGEYLDCHCNAGRLGDLSVDIRDIPHSDSCPFLQYVAFLGLDPHEVKATAAVVVCVDRDETVFVDRCYKGDKTLKDVKRDLNKILGLYRYGFGKCDPHADSDRTAFDNINAWKILTKGENPIPNLKKADSYKGSILAGVDVIRQLLIGHDAEHPRLMVIDRPENQELIHSFRTLQRDTFANEDTRGPKDAIAEGKHDHHAALRYILQSPLRWYPLEAYERGDMRQAEEAVEAMYA
jgi:phage terminase large subunit-like protein